MGPGSRHADARPRWGATAGRPWRGWMASGVDEEVRERLRTLAAHGWAYRRLLRWAVAALWALAAIEVLRLLVELAVLWRGP